MAPLDTYTKCMSVSFTGYTYLGKIIQFLQVVLKAWIIPCKGKQVITLKLSYPPLSRLIPAEGKED